MADYRNMLGKLREASEIASILKDEVLQYLIGMAIDEIEDKLKGRMTNEAPPILQISVPRSKSDN